MEFKHFLHPHNLSFTEVGKENDSMICFLCLDIINGPAYICNTCDYGKFSLHKPCAELPPQIQKEAFHPHPLRFTLGEVIVCDGCAKLWGGVINYRCMDCTFNLDFRCALAISNDYELAVADHVCLQEARRIKTTIHHFSHYHQLTRCKFSLMKTKTDVLYIFKKLWESDEFKSMACKQELHGTLTYTCIPCRFLFHESCVNDMPSQVLHSPFHPQHILLPRPIRKGSSLKCSACRHDVEGISFCCNQCDIKLHVSCAKYRTRAIKHNCHPDHLLLHLGKSNMSKIFCKACHKDCDDSGVYYCDACETERNPEHHVYYCEECKYIAHIGCALSEVEATEEIFLDQRIEENSDKADIGDKIMNRKIMELEGTLVHNEKVSLNSN
ncbi:hypothetical protein PTKIN_Ptkin01aG0355000 [Pterospermum kingtungense]